MRKDTPYISTMPLDLLAFVFVSLSLITCSMYLFIAANIFCQYSPINIKVKTEGYAILITKKSLPHSGYGIMLRNGFQLWQYQKQKNNEKSETRIFPS
ncbi:MAG: hypothetical protein HY810_04645 [Candidatus Omnitrophica bacterium]|nr:hypothetical protein [Candidatus Omnitrophota bacterium]